MNRNSKSRLNVAKQNKHKGNKQSQFAVPKIISGVGERASWGTYGTKTVNFAVQPRLSTKPKVGGKNGKTKTVEEI